MSVFPFSFKEIVVAMGTQHLISLNKISALESRIKDFQRREFPPGLNTGKGRAARYEVHHLILLGIAFQLLEMGMSPDRICGLLRSTGDTLVEQVKSMCSGGLFRHRKTLIYFDPAALASLRDADSEGNGDGFSVGTVAEVTQLLSKVELGTTRLAVIDLRKFLVILITVIAGAKDVTEKEAIAALVNWAKPA